MRLPDSALTDGLWTSVILVQVTLVALLGCLAWLAARRGRPALRSAIVLSALAALLLAPSLCLVVPVWMPLPEWVWRAGAESLTVEPSDGAPAPPLSPSGDAAVFAVLVPQPPTKDLQVGDDPAKQADEMDATPVKTEAVVFRVVAAPEDAAQPARSDDPIHSSWTWASLLGGIWLLGATVCLFRALIRLALLYRCAWKARPVRKRAWTDCVALLTRRHGQARVALRESRTLASPLTLGLFRPVILLPHGLRRWSAEQRVLILEHELAHIRRRDFLAGLVAELAVCLCWFHPLVRWLAGRLRLEQEYAADACVAAARTDPTEYLRCLARLALELERGHGPLAPAFWRRRPEIMRRIDMLRRNPKDISTHLGKRAGFTVAVLAAAICVAVSGIGPLRSNVEGEPFSPAVAGTTEKATTDAQGDPLPDGALARLGTMRMRHGAEVTFVAFGPRGETLLTAGRDSTIRLWDLKTGKEIRRFARPKPTKPKPTAEGQKEKAQAAGVLRLMGRAGNQAGDPRIALSSDGKILAVGGGNVVQLYDVETGAELRQIDGPAQGAASLLFSPDGRTLAARTTNGALWFWETNTGKEIRQIKPAPRPKQEAFVVFLGGGGSDAPGMAFTPDGKVLAAAATDFKEQEAISSLKLWDLTTGKELRRINPPGNNDVSVVAISPNGEVLAYGDINTVHLCEVKTGKELRQLKLSGLGITTLRFTGDGKTLAVRSRDQRVSLWDTKTGKEIRLFTEAQPLQQANGLVFFVRGFSSPEARALAISPDGKHLASTSGSTVRLWEIATGKELQLTEGHRRTPIILALSRDGKTIVSWGEDRVVHRWDAATGKSLGAFPAPPGTTGAALSADGRTVALANADNTIRLHDTANGKELHRIKSHANGIATLAFSSDGKMLASRGSGDNSIRLYDVASGDELRQFALRTGRDNTDGRRFAVVSLVGSPRVAAGVGMAFTPDNKLLIVPGPSNNPGKTLAVCDVATGKELRRIESPQAITSLAISPDGRTLAAENADQTISLWEIASGKRRGQLGKPAAELSQPNGQRMTVAIADIDGRFNGFSEPAGPVGLAFSNDGRALASGSSDQSVRLWDVNTGKEIGRFKGHQGRTQTVAFAPDGRRLASGATDTTILLWVTITPTKELAKEQAVELPHGEMQTLWSDLAAEDATKAFQGVLKLSAVPRQAVSFLGARLKPAERIDPRKIDGWVADLESEKYSVRQDAIASLLKTGEQALPALRQVLGATPRLETRKRVEELVLKLTDGNLSAEQLQLVRSIEVLERIGSEEARRILRTLAQGAPATLPTREAETALKRLAESH